MLTLKYIMKVRRMMEQTGGYELPEDYLSQDARPPADLPRNPRGRSISLSLDYYFDEETGDVRIVKRE